MALSGAIDGVMGRFVVGWVHDPDDADHRVELEVELDGKLVGSGVADLERGDLLAARIGDGRHAFRIELPEALQPGTEHVLAVRPVQGGGSLPLPSDCRVEFEPGVSGPPAALRQDSAYAVKGAPSDDWLTGVPLTAPQALVGVEGWLFEPHPQQTMDLILGRAELSTDALGRATDRLRRRYARLHELGVPYVFAVIPDKAAVYADRLAPGVQSRCAPRAVETIAAALIHDNGIELLDLLPALRHARQYGPVYPRTGAGLSWLGASYAYRAVAKELAKRAPAIQPRPLEQFELALEVPVQASLAAREQVVFIGGERKVVMNDPDTPETEPELAPTVTQASYVPVPPEVEARVGRGASLLTRARADVPTSAVVVHDGRGSRIATLLADHFGSTLVVVGDEPPYAALEGAGAAVLVQLVGEASECG